MKASGLTGISPATPVVPDPGDTVIAVGLRPELLWRSLRQSATFVISTRTTVLTTSARDSRGSVKLTVSQDAFERAFDSLRLGGRLICVARPVVPSRRIPVFELFVTGCSIIGPIPAACHHMADIFELFATGQGRMVTQLPSK